MWEEAKRSIKNVAWTFVGTFDGTFAQVLDAALRPLLESSFGQQPSSAQIAQLVEHLTENQGVRGSNPRLGTNRINGLRRFGPRVTFSKGTEKGHPDF